jgi:hypothetical protein
MRVLVEKHIVEAEYIERIDNRIIVYSVNRSNIFEIGIRSEKVATNVFEVIKSSLFNANAVNVDGIMALRVPNKEDWSVNRIK